jgi:hypothetical protein
MSAVHFWDGERVLTTTMGTGAQSLRALIQDQGLNDHLCVYPMREDPMYRYGYWEWNLQWVPRDIDSFPPAFKAHLLLLGVG